MSQCVSVFLPSERQRLPAVTHLYINLYLSTQSIKITTQVSVWSSPLHQQRFLLNQALFNSFSIVQKHSKHGIDTTSTCQPAESRHISRWKVVRMGSHIFNKVLQHKAALGIDKNKSCPHLYEGVDGETQGTWKLLNGRWNYFVYRNRKNVRANDTESYPTIYMLMHDHKSLQQTVLNRLNDQFEQTSQNHQWTFSSPWSGSWFPTGSPHPNLHYIVFLMAGAQTEDLGSIGSEVCDLGCYDLLRDWAICTSFSSLH